ncbi:MAG: prepilin-type N-terminal cleavage/methylation domain-containing protein [Steroidobacteraceae bacterium]
MNPRGITLVEMLVSLLLGSILIAGALTGLGQAQRAWHDATVQGRLHERAQYVFATLEPELQMAGYFGAGGEPATPPVPPWPAGAESCGSGLLWPLSPSIRIHEGTWPLACPAQGGGAQPGADVLELRRASVVSGAISPGALYLTGHPLHPALAALQGAPAGPLPALQPGEERRELRLRIFYVARAADGDPRTPALRVKSLTAIAGEPAFIDTEVMPGVQDLQIELLPSAASAQTLRVRLRITADAADLRPGTAPAALDITRRFALRNAPALSS